jgi:hypothetical protein
MHRSNRTSQRQMHRSLPFRHILWDTVHRTSTHTNISSLKGCENSSVCGSEWRLLPNLFPSISVVWVEPCCLSQTAQHYSHRMPAVSHRLHSITATECRLPLTDCTALQPQSLLTNLKSNIQSCNTILYVLSINGPTVSKLCYLITYIHTTEVKMSWLGLASSATARNKIIWKMWKRTAPEGAKMWQT